MRWTHWLRPGLALLLLGVAFVVLHDRLSQLRPAEVLQALDALPRTNIVLAIALTALNHVLLSLYDVAALSYLKKTLPGPRILLISFVATSFAHNIGPSIASGGSVRYKYYSEAGLRAREIATLVSFIAVTFFIGYCWLGGAVLATTPSDMKFGALLRVPLLRSIGVVLFALGVGYLALCALKRSVTVRGRTLALPSPRLAFLQIAVSSNDWLMMTMILSLFLPPGALGYSELLHTLVVAQIAAMLSQVPGGDGVFESLMLTALGPAMSAPRLVAALVAYRVIYFFTPLALGVLILLGSELRVRLARRRVAV